jgi:hypothetical protein
MQAASATGLESAAPTRAAPGTSQSAQDASSDDTFDADYDAVLAGLAAKGLLEDPDTDQ